ncbi:MAG: right-handed parallel beta-helix repeat-containing protein [Phycisphaeraceae bacterium]|nr:right-handed parallel beta-helix repeat-containing protein [Phycisphaeraceae bacterium]
MTSLPIVHSGVPACGIVLALSLWLPITDRACADTIHVPGDYGTIQAAIAAAAEGDEIVVAPGIYGESIDFLGKALHLRGSDGPAVTVIDAGGLGVRVMRISGSGAGTRVEGFTLTGGVAGAPTPLNIGGGMLIVNSSPEVHDCRFLNNTATGSFSEGGGMAVHSGSPTVTDCHFEGNQAHMGAAMNNDSGSSPVVTGCTFVNNTANFGAGMRNTNGSHPTVSGCLFADNTAGTSGGGMLNQSSSPAVHDCIFSGNSAPLGGGMDSTSSSNPEVVGCNFTGNAASMFGGGMLSSGGSKPSVIDCLFEGNTAPEGGGAIHSGSGSMDPAIGESHFCGNVPEHIDGGWVDLGSNTFSDTCSTCPADLDGSGTVDFADALLLLSAWGPCDGTPCAADLDGNESVDFADLLSLLAAWGTGC